MIYVVNTQPQNGCPITYWADGLTDAAYMAANNALWERDARHTVGKEWWDHGYRTEMIWDVAGYTDN